MHVITKRMVLNGVIDRWLRQYPLFIWVGTDREITYKKLFALGDAPSKEDIDKIIGNDSWTKLLCFECEQDSELVVFFQDDFGDSFQLCKHCLNKSVSLGGGV